MSAPTENMNRLMKKKDELEADIKALFEVLDSVNIQGIVCFTIILYIVATNNILSQQI